MSYIFIYVDHNWHFYVCKLMISVGNLSILIDFWTCLWPKCSTAVSMATAMQMDERIVDYLVLGDNTQDRKVSAKSVTMRATALCKNLSGYRELLLIGFGTEAGEIIIIFFRARRSYRFIIHSSRSQHAFSSGILSSQNHLSSFE